MNERLRQIVNHRATLPAAVGAVCFGAGVGLGYFLARRRKNEIHVVPQPTEFNLEEVADFIKKHHPDGENVDLSPVYPSQKVELVVPEEDFVGIETPVREEVEKFIEEQLKEHDEMEQLPQKAPPREETATLRPFIPPEPDIQIVEQNVFANNGDGDWNYEEEVRHRSETEPYILHKDEFYADEKNYSQMTLTYYAGDDILTDEDDKPVYNHRNIVGELKFGHGSGDPNVVYVRNDKNRAEYEVLYHEGLYSVEVLGLEIENNERARDIKHSEHTKFRME